MSDPTPEARDDALLDRLQDAEGRLRTDLAMAKAHSERWEVRAVEAEMRFEQLTTEHDTLRLALRGLYDFLIENLDNDPAPCGDYLTDPETRELATLVCADLFLARTEGDKP